MSSFQIYLQLGISHITDIQGYDHILFLITLCATYQIKQWKNVLMLITAFTIGHCLTLILSVYNLFVISSSIIEFLIPLTILITAITNIYKTKKNTQHKFQTFNYSTTLFFGLIHGLGFSYYLKALLGAETNIIKPLFAFNLGIEMGQLLIVICYFTITVLITIIVKLNKKYWTFIISSVCLVISLILLITRIPL